MTSDANEPKAGAAGKLLCATAVRVRADTLLDLGLAGKLEHFTLDMARLDGLADQVAEVLAETAGEEGAPFFACWRSFEVGGHDRWAMLGAYRQWEDVREMGRAAFDLAFLTAILGADAGPIWRYREAATGEIHAGADGLAIATLAMFSAGLFSADPIDPLRADATVLARLTDKEIATGLQHGDGNDLPGIDGRGNLLRRLGEAVALRDDLFLADDDLRPGCLFDKLMEEGWQAPLPAGRILEAVLDGLTAIWPNREAIDGIPLGDTWRYAKLADESDAGALIPLHTMAQKISYSLIEPLIWAGVEVGAFDQLTGLADLVHGGLFVDAGVLKPRDPQEVSFAHDASTPFVVEWRGLTVALIDRLAARVRAGAELDAQGLPLACVMQGGTLPLARKIALEKRGDGRPLLGLASDGTVV